MKGLFIAAGAMVLLASVPARADRPPKIEELSRIEAVLALQGFQRWDEIELEREGWEIHDAVAADGRQYDLLLDPVTLVILSSRLD